MTLRINQAAASSWPHKILVAIDMLAGVTTAMPYDLTISTYVGMVKVGLQPQYMPSRRWKIRLCCWVADTLERIQPGHCAQAKLADIQRAQEAITFMQTGVDPT